MRKCERVSEVYGGMVNEVGGVAVDGVGEGFVHRTSKCNCNWGRGWGHLQLQRASACTAYALLAVAVHCCGVHQW